MTPDAHAEHFNKRLNIKKSIAESLHRGIVIKKIKDNNSLK